jgi:hypothetical protein
MRRITEGRDEDHTLQGAVPYKILIERESLEDSVDRGQSVRVCLRRWLREWHNLAFDKPK